MFGGRSKRELEKSAEAVRALTAEVERLKAENGRTAAILNSMIEGVIAVDRDSRILSVNPTIERIFGITQQVVDKIFLEAIPNNDLYEVICAVTRDGVSVTRELTLVWPVQRVFQVSASPILRAQSLAGCLLVIHDVTAMRKLETVRADFVANVSHELKTPLTSITGFVETLLEGALDDKENSREFLKIIQAQADRLNNLVNDLLELSYLESRQIQLEPIAFDLRALCGEVAAGFGAQLRKKALAIENNIGPVTVTADKERIRQVFTNLVDNAIKYTREKTAIRLSSEQSGCLVKISVSDDGPGIPARELSRLFERFYRVDKARSREMGGTGLGLAIVKHIIELHGGTVGVESTEGAGSTFWFTLSAA